MKPSQRFLKYYMTDIFYVFQKMLSRKLIHNIRAETCINNKNTELVITNGNIVPQISVSDNATELITTIPHPGETTRSSQGDPNSKNMHNGYTTVTKAKPRTKRLLTPFNDNIKGEQNRTNLSQ